MLKTAAWALSLALLLSACIPELPIPQLNNTTPQSIESQATNAVPTTAAPTDTPTPIPSPTSLLISDTPEATGTLSGTTIAETQINETLTAVQGTALASGTPEATSTPTIGLASDPIATETLHARFFGTLPPAIAYGKIELVNKAKAEVYISMQCTTVEGTITILEYPVVRTMRVSAPAGRYTYVVWAGGRQFQGAFGLGKSEERMITIYKDKVTVK